MLALPLLLETCLPLLWSPLFPLHAPAFISLSLTKVWLSLPFTLSTLTVNSLLLSSYLCRIGKIENPSCIACGHSSQDTSHSALSSYGLFAPLALCRLSVSLRALVQALKSCPPSGAPWSSAMPHPSEGIRKQQQVTKPKKNNLLNTIAYITVKFTRTTRTSKCLLEKNLTEALQLLSKTSNYTRTLNKILLLKYRSPQLVENFFG